jgi:hypothetical protein
VTGPAGNSGHEPVRAEPDVVRDIARAVLYEGYMLWPYGHRTLKNQRRWTFGGVFPHDWTRAGHEDDACTMRAEFLIELPDSAAASPTIDVSLRFLHIVSRRVARMESGALCYVDALEMDGTRHVTWDEASEREIRLSGLPVDGASPVTQEIQIPSGEVREELRNANGRHAGTIVRSWRALHGSLTVRVQPQGGGRLVRVRVIARNDTHWSGDGRECALRSSFNSTHIALRAEGADFISLTDPPAWATSATAACVNEGCWPVLVGDRASRSQLLASPIILADYPQVAPESPGDLFDGGEIDELLVLNILGLTDAEHADMRAADPRTREILERTQSLSREQILGLHGTFRDVSDRSPWRPAGGDDE